MFFPIAAIRQLRLMYLQLPGLSLTPRQAARLCDVQPAESTVALAALVDTGFLTNVGGQFLRTAPADERPDAIGKAHAAPCDCRWARPIPTAPDDTPPTASYGRWICVRDGAPRSLDVRDCVACARWDPQLSTRRRRLSVPLMPLHTGRPNGPVRP